MPNGVRALSRRGIDKVGSCGVCGLVGALSDTHVPPKCAGNDGMAMPLVESTDANGARYLASGRGRQNGARGWLLCESCNQFAGAHYDQQFGSYWLYFAKLLLTDDLHRLVGSPRVISTTGVDPGAIVRCVMSGLMGMCPPLREDFPVLQPAVQLGEVVSPPDGLHLLLALYAGPRRSVYGGGTAKIEYRRGFAARSLFAWAELAWPPFDFLLTDETGRSEYPTSQDVMPWLLDAPGERRTVDLLLPVLGEGDLFSASMSRNREAPIMDGPNGGRFVPEAR